MDGPWLTCCALQLQRFLSWGELVQSPILDQEPCGGCVGDVTEGVGEVHAREVCRHAFLAQVAATSVPEETGVIGAAGFNYDGLKLMFHPRENTCDCGPVAEADIADSRYVDVRSSGEKVYSAS